MRYTARVSRIFLRLAVPVAFLLLPLAVSAQEIYVPRLALDSDLSPVIAGSLSSADGFVEGKGPLLRLTYASVVPLHMFIAPMINATDYNPGDMYAVDLPAGSEPAEIDLTALTKWSPGMKRYYVSFLSGGSETDAEIQNIEIHGGNIGSTIMAAGRHLFQPEPYWVSNVHFLRGRRVLGVPLAVVGGMLTIVLTAVVFVWKKKRLAPALLSLLLCALVSQLLMATDAGRLAFTHTKEWLTGGTFAQPQDLYLVAADLEEAQQDVDVPLSITVCFDASDYEAKLLRYLLAPVNVSINQTINEKTSHIVVLPSAKRDPGEETETCDFQDRVERLEKTYPSGTRVYALRHA